MVEIAPFTQLQADHLKEYFEGHHKVLEIGCGSGRMTFALAPLVKKWYAIDTNQAAIKEAEGYRQNFEHKRRIKFKVAKGENTGFKRRFYKPFKKKFDVVFYSFSLHFLKHPLAGLEEAYRILKPGGLLLIIEPKKNTDFMIVWSLIDKQSLDKKETMIAYMERDIISVNQKNWFRLKNIQTINTPIRGDSNTLAEILEKNIESMERIPTFERLEMNRKIGVILSERKIYEGGVYEIPHAANLFVLEKHK